MVNQDGNISPRFRHFQKILQGIDVSGVLAELDAHPELWDAHTVRKTAPGTPHSGMSDIWVRYNDVAPFAKTGDYRGFNDLHVPIWYPAWDALPSLHPIVHGINATVMGEMIGGVLITKIPPGKGIDLHFDRGWHVDYFDKFYLSLKSPSGAIFGCLKDGHEEILSPQAGDVWRFDNRKPHWVQNDSPSEDRITLIVCVRTHLFRGKIDDL